MAQLNPEFDFVPKEVLEGCVAVVTGGASGIGFATAQLLLSYGVNVVVGDINVLENVTRSSELSMSRTSLTFVQVNATKWKDLQTLFKVANERYGRIDFVFANAGTIQQGVPFMEEVIDNDGDLIEPDHSTLDLNLIAVMNTARLAIWYMKNNPNGGSIVLSASPAGFQRFPAVHYTTSKHGVVGFLRTLYSNLSETLIRVNAVAPSWTETGLISRELTDRAGLVIQPPEAVAKVVTGLFADKTKNGEVIYSVAGNAVEVEEQIALSVQKAMPCSSGKLALEEGYLYIEALRVENDVT